MKFKANLFSQWFLMASLGIIVAVLLICLVPKSYKSSPIRIQSLKEDAPVQPSSLMFQLFEKYPNLPAIKSRHDLSSRRVIFNDMVAVLKGESLNLELSVEQKELEDDINNLEEIIEETAEETLEESFEKQLEDRVARRYGQGWEPVEEILNEEEMMHRSKQDSVTILTTDDVHKLCSVSKEATKPMYNHAKRKLDNGAIAELVDLVVYINLDEHKKQRHKIEEEIKRVIVKEDRIDSLRIKGEKKEDGTISKLLSHVTALAVACEDQRNVMVLEDDFSFFVSRDDLSKHLKLVHMQFEDRWNVIVLGEYMQHDQEWSVIDGAKDLENRIQLMRLSNVSSMTGYIVNRTYAPILLNLWVDQIYREQNDQKLMPISQEDLWLGFESPVGGTHEWNDLSSYMFDEKPKWQVQDVGIYIKASIDQQAILNEILRILYVDTNKGNRVHIAVHHPEGQKFNNRHKRSYSTNFYAGVKYFWETSLIQAFLKPYDQVLFIDLSTKDKWEENKEQLIQQLKNSSTLTAKQLEEMLTT